MSHSIPRTAGSLPIRLCAPAPTNDFCHRGPTLEDDDLRDYFFQPFGPKPSGKTTDSKTDLGELIREIDELAVFNDEAHHIHDERMAWFGSIRDIHHRMLQKDRRLALQIDVTATPRHDNGAIFVQTVSDYPLVEAIHQGVVKHPVLPDAASRARLTEQPSAIFHEKFADYLALGVEEWKKSYDEHQRLGKKAVLFVMVDDTRNCDDVGAHLERICPELQGAVLAPMRQPATSCLSRRWAVGCAACTESEVPPQATRRARRRLKPSRSWACPPL